MKLKDKAIIVTGSSMGIGEAIARRAVAEGARVMVHGIEKAETETVAESLKMLCCVGDISDPGHCVDLVSAAVAEFAEFGELHGLVNNAGVVWRNLFEGTDAAFWDSVMNINARALMLQLGKAEVPYGRLIAPEEIASTAVHFLSDEFGPMSGQVIELSQYPHIGRNPPKC